MLLFRQYQKMKLLFFLFKKFNNKYLITNDLGRYLFADKKELFSLINNDSPYKKDMLAAR